MKREIGDYLQDIVEYMVRAEEYIKDLSYQKFLEDRKTCDAVIRCIEVIGEAAKNIPLGIRKEYPEIPWKDMAGMRDKVIHGYFGVKIERAWLTVKEDIPRIKPFVKDVLSNWEENEC